MSEMKGKRYPSQKRRRQPSRLPLLIALGGALVLVLALALLFQNRGNPPGQQPGVSQPDQPMATVPVEVQGSPALRVNQERVDLGDVKLGETVQVDFVVSNAGSEPLQLTQAPYVEVVEGC